MPRKALLVACLTLIAGATNAGQLVEPGECAVTVFSGGFYGSSELATNGLWPGGEIIFRSGGPGFVTSDGALGMKFGWLRGVAGKLAITGRRLDSDASSLRAEVKDGYGDSGFQSSYLIFPTPGCWEVTGRVANASVTFVTRVMKVGDGPSWRRP